MAPARASCAEIVRNDTSAGALPCRRQSPDDPLLFVVQSADAKRGPPTSLNGPWYPLCQVERCAVRIQRRVRRNVPQRRGAPVYCRRRHLQLDRQTPGSGGAGIRWRTFVDRIVLPRFLQLAFVLRAHHVSPSNEGTSSGLVTFRRVFCDNRFRRYRPHHRLGCTRAQRRALLRRHAVARRVCEPGAIYGPPHLYGQRVPVYVQQAPVYAQPAQVHVVPDRRRAWRSRDLVDRRRQHG